MNIEQFQAGNWIPSKGYRYFLPEKINHDFFWNDSAINELLEQASQTVGELNSFSRFVPDTDHFIKAYVAKEAVVSSRIEGTQTTLQEAFMQEANIGSERKNDYREVINYTVAMNDAISDLKKLPLSNRLIKQAHARLLQSVRGMDKTPGEYRRSQNWIGGATLKDAVFIPPTDDHLNELMSDLELFLHNEKIHVPQLVRIAIAHYQFETIHPFLDGNGRVGRLLITLYLVSTGRLSKPLLYLSDFFEKNKPLYYDNLMRVRTHNDLQQWLKFFLAGITETGLEANATLKKVVQLKEKLLEQKVMMMGKKTTNAVLLLNYLFKQPVATITQISEGLNLTNKTAGFLIRTFEEAKMVKEITGAARDRIFVFDAYLKIFRT
jgi:Fic family protein